MTVRGWRAPPQLAEKIAALAQETMKCGACGAAPGEPCANPEPGRTVHGNRWVGTMIAYRRQSRARRNAAAATTNGRTTQ